MFYHTKHMLNFCPCSVAFAIKWFVRTIESPVFPNLTADTPVYVGSLGISSLFIVRVSLISINRLLIACSNSSMTWESCTEASVTLTWYTLPCKSLPTRTLHAKVPIIALASWFHFRVTLVLFILGWTWGRNNSRINNGSFFEQHALLTEILTGLHK